MFFREIYEEGLAQASYVVGCPETGKALVVDPRRDIQAYLDVAAREELRIIAVTETHIHADYLSGARELALAAGATLYVSGTGGPGWEYGGLDGIDHQIMRDGHLLDVGQVRVQALHTPGHTPEHMSFLVHDGADAIEPMLVLSGDFVFVGDVGRPDLIEQAIGVAGSAETGARTMYRSLRERFLTLPDFVQVWPGHGAGSACGKALAAIPSTTVGYERRVSWWSGYLRSGDEAGFMRELLDGQPDAPTYFARMKRMNRDGMPVLRRLPEPVQMDSAALRAAVANGAVVIDARSVEEFAEQHVDGSINVPDGDRFSTWSAWVTPEGAPIILVTRAGRVDELVRRLVRVGLDDVIGWISVDAPGLAKSRLPQANVDEARALWHAGNALILDVRNAGEFRMEHIPGAVQLSAGRIMRMLDDVPRDRTVVVHCATGARASVAASALQARGFDNVVCMTGGIHEWQRSGYPLESGGQTASV
ncbi:MAG TPA: MBL fold metallo-hydrolase [Candidatus Eremiobacteraceae bacterium]|nr:MBL fold metallo-hydrolase [Candidatus Eremiobacteraceae bacterium]